MPARFDERSLLTPSIIFEVHSPSTATNDFTIKNDLYLQFPSLLAYVLVAQDFRRVEVRRPNEKGWNSTVYNRRDDIIELPEIGVSFPITEVYERLEASSSLANT